MSPSLNDRANESFKAYFLDLLRENLGLDVADQKERMKEFVMETYNFMRRHLLQNQIQEEEVFSIQRTQSSVQNNLTMIIANIRSEFKMMDWKSFQQEIITQFFLQRKILMDEKGRLDLIEWQAQDKSNKIYEENSHKQIQRWSLPKSQAQKIEISSKNYREALQENSHKQIQRWSLPKSQAQKIEISSKNYREALQENSHKQIQRQRRNLPKEKVSKFKINLKNQREPLNQSHILHNVFKINSNKRRIFLYDWLFRVGNQLDISKDAIYSAFSYIDAFVSIAQDKLSLQKIGLVALYLAAKLTCHYRLTFKDFQKYFQGKITLMQTVEIQSQIKSCLKNRPIQTNLYDNMIEIIEKFQEFTSQKNQHEYEHQNGEVSCGYFQICKNKQCCLSGILWILDGVILQGYDPQFSQQMICLSVICLWMQKRISRQFYHQQSKLQGQVLQMRQQEQYQLHKKIDSIIIEFLGQDSQEKKYEITSCLESFNQWQYYGLKSLSLDSTQIGYHEFTIQAVFQIMRKSANSSLENSLYKKNSKTIY